MATKYLTSPPKITTMPPGVPYIVGNEAAERFSYYGMNSILTIFMTKYLLDRMGNLAVMQPAAAEAWSAGNSSGITLRAAPADRARVLPYLTTTVSVSVLSGPRVWSPASCEVCTFFAVSL